jgi:hypothetical protein
MPALPESVRKAAELSNQLQQKSKAGTLTFEDVNMRADQVQMPTAQQPMPVGFQPQPAGTGVPGLGTPGFNPQPAAAPAQPQPQSVASTPPPQPQEDPAAEQRFKVLQGKYNAEVPRLHEEKKNLAKQNEALQNQLAATQALLANLAQPPVIHTHAPEQSLVTPKEVQEYGADLIDVVRRVAQEVVQPKIRTLEEQFRPVAQTVQQLAPQVQQTAESQQKTAADLAHEQMCNALDSAVVDANGNSIWERINESPEFQAWLAQTDPYAGAQRGAMLAQAYRNQDLPRVAAFFTGFMKENAAVAPTGQQQTRTPAGANQPGTPNVSLASLAAPGTGVGGPVNAGAPNEPGQSRVYTQSEISAFYKDVQKGAYRGRDADRIAIEKDIFNASKTGRIRP